MVISKFIDISKCLEGSMFLPKNCGFAKEARFYLEAAISAADLKLPVTVAGPRGQGLNILGG